jgi:outer membrane protein TolC
MSFGEYSMASRQTSTHQKKPQKMKQKSNLSIRRFFTVALCLLVPQFCISQQGIIDSLTFENFREMVLTNHPLMKVAGLNIDRAESNMRIARGSFDPKLAASLDNKFFKNAEYYNLQRVELKLPTASPISLKGGFERNTGAFFNPENQTPDEGLLLAGVSVPLIQGIITDERRIALRIAEAFSGFSVQQQDIIVNETLSNAYVQFWNWWNAYQKSAIADSILSITRLRMDAVRSRALGGDLPLIDTLETFTQILNREQISQEMNIQELKERLALSTFLWDASGNELLAIVIPDGIIPSPFMTSNRFRVTKDNYLQQLENIGATNPMLMQYEWKFKSLRAEEKWKKEKLKPLLNVNYNFLAVPTNPGSDVGFSTNNYKWGLEFAFPLLLRKERGELQMTRIKIQETILEQNLKTQETKNKATTLYESLTLLRNQLEFAERNQNNYLLLLDAERDKFFNGESSVFLVNMREQQYADSRIKVVEIQTKIRTSETELSYMLGTIE